MPETPARPDDDETGRIRSLAAVLNEAGLTEIEIERDGLRVRIARRQETVAAVQTAVPAGTAPLPAMPVPAMPVAAAPVPAAPAVPAEDLSGAVRAPMVGTVYLSPSPGADPFVRTGSRVSAGQTVLIVEAMKTMNPVTAPRSGTVGSILVENAQPVEFDEVLLVIT